MIIPSDTGRHIEHHNGIAALSHTRLALPDLENQSAALLKPIVAGVCRSDLREIAATRYGRTDFGHEIVATVAATTPELADRRGSTVVFDPHPPLAARSSGFADVVSLCGTPDNVRAALVPAPPGVAADVAVFTEPLACAVHCARRASELTRDPAASIAIFGAGMTGTLIAAALTATGRSCRLTNRSSQRLQFLRHRRALPARVLDPDPIGDAATVILATAALTASDLDTALSMLAEGGTVILFSGTTPAQEIAGIDVDAVRRHQRHARVTVPGYQPAFFAGSYGATRADFETAGELLAAPPTLDGWSPARCTRRLITQQLGLDDAADHLNAALTHPHFGKTLIWINPAEHR
ncbi:medium chain dehydrogenase/reductase family protein [Nocardia sp. NPDC050435]|uniref:medium chain dehydrogenase/reductase family protein n=1 Tax=Nocardia sp. NPDC050435 TaxID=3155040 RepID=UPI003404048B